MSRQVSRGSAGHYQAHEQAGVSWLRGCLPESTSPLLYVQTFSYNPEKRILGDLSISSKIDYLKEGRPKSMALS